MPRHSHIPNLAFRCSSRGSAHRMTAPRSGFALLITITLVAFLVLILVGLASFTRIETTVASNSQQMAMARQNALVALHIALGELQKYAGPDQRATAAADIGIAAPQTGTRHWTGVWGNAANPQSDLSSTPVLLQWLVSGNDSVVFDPASAVSIAPASFGRILTAPSGWAYTPSSSVSGVVSGVSTDTALTIGGDNAALLVGPRTAGDDPADYIIAPLKDIDVPAANIAGHAASAPDVTIGRYAWWVGDEGVKARVNLVDPYVLPTAGMQSAGVVAEPASLFRMLAPQRMGVESVSGFEGFPVNTASARDVLSLTQASFASAGITPTILHSRFHDLTTVSSGVLVDQLRGGLSSDFTYAFARDDVSEFRAALELPSLVASNPLLPVAIMPVSEGRVPTWEQLRSYARLDGSAPVAPRAQTADEHGIYPVLAQARLGVGGQIVADGANSRFSLRIAPSFVLANPYNAVIAAATYRLRVDFAANSDVSAFIGNAPDSFWRMPLRELLEGQVFEIRAPAFQPGEARVFTLSTDNVPWAPVQTLVMDNDWSDFAIELDTSTHGGGTFDETVPFAYPNPSNPAANLYAKGVHLVFGDGHPTTTAVWGNGSAAPGPRLTLTNGGFQRGGTLSWALLDSNNVMLQRIENMGYAVNPASMYGIRGETIQNSGSSILRIADAGNFAANRVYPQYSQFNWRAPLISRTDRYALRINALVSWNQVFHQNTSADPTLERWMIRKQTVPPFTTVEWNGVVGTQNSRPLAQDNWRPFDIPRAPAGLASLGQLQHFNASGYYDITYPAPASPLASRPASPSLQRARYLTATYAIGNSRANPHVPAGDVKATLESQPYYDVGYLLNRALFDGHFFSGYPQTGAVNLATRRLPNARLHPIRATVSPDDTVAFRGSDTVFAVGDVRRAARNLMLSGAFNVNSTSAPAWMAVLSALRGTELNGKTDLVAPFPRSVHQPGGTNGADTGGTADAWNGFRDLTQLQIADLAAKIVTEIRARGPFLSLADFVNRSLTSSTPAHTYAGPLQAALDSTDINAAFINTVANSGGTNVTFPAPADATITIPYDHKEHLAKHGLEGIAGWLTQADILQALAPMLSARADTFRIRTYGEVCNPITKNLEGRAWCEAIVQRLPDYVSEADDAMSLPKDLTSADKQLRAPLCHRGFPLAFRGRYLTHLLPNRELTPSLFALFCLLAMAVHIPLDAQPAASSIDATTTTLNLRFMSWESAVTNLLLRDARGDFVPVTIPAYNWGPTYEIPATGDTLALYREIEQDGVKTHQVAAQARLEPGCREFQVALVRQNGEQPYRMIALPRDLHVFGAGIVRVFNFSPHPIAVRLGEQEIQLGPLEWRLVTVSPDNKYRVVMLSAIQVDGTWVSGGNRVISLRPDHRGDLMLVHSGTRVGLAPGVASDIADLTQTIIETEYISPRMRRLDAGK